MAKLTLKDLQALRAAECAKVATRKAAGKDIEVLVGMGTCGVAAGSREALVAMQEEVAALKLGNVTIKQTGCMGLCYSEPTVEVRVPGMPAAIYGRVNQAVARTIIQEHVAQKKPLTDYLYAKPSADLVENEVDASCKQMRIVLRNCGVIDPENINEYFARSGYVALEKALFELKPDGVINELKKSGLRGRGGAGFPTWQKWMFTKNAQSDQKYIVCNADEGDPGAYMDRSTLEGDPCSVIEAMTIAGFAVGASQGYVYIRAEYPLAIKRLNIAIAQATDLGLLGDKILGSDFSFNIEVRLGAGAFVCGEETALLASLEGKRGMPSPRPPFPATKGLWGKPTVINNVETLANIPFIIVKGGEWFGAIGTENSKGTKVFALTGKIANSGLIEVPMGITLREIVYEIGGGILNGKEFKAVQTGGPSGGVIKAEYLDTPIDYQTLQKLGSIMGSGGMIVMDEDDCMVDITKFYLDFAVDESCGKCAPCRIGGRQLMSIYEKLTGGTGTMEDIQNIKLIGQAMRRASLCGLGQTTPNPAISTLTYFEDEYLAHINEKRCPSKKCTNLLNFYILPDKCIGCGLCAKRCPTSAITGDKRQPHVIDSAKCSKCGECYQVCKFSAVTKN